MVSCDEDAFICDMAETYHIYDYRELPVNYCATLAAGLRDTSRIKGKMSGFETTLDIVLSALISDNVSTMLWFQTKDGQKNINRPPSILKAIMPDEKENKIVAFDSPMAFEMARKKLLGV